MRSVVLLILAASLTGCASKKPAKPSAYIPKGCAKVVEPIGPCTADPDGIHATCSTRITYSCVEYK